MIAMQYSFTLPADYDMAIIDRRIADKGHLMDGFAGLVFKAYASARGSAALPPASENLYAPFYLWQSAQAMNAVLTGPGFVGLTQAFGWPSIKIWSVWHAGLAPEVAAARYASRELIPITPHTDLDALCEAETRRAQAALAERNVLASIAGFEPTSWTLVRFKLLAKPLPEASQACLPGQLLYSVGHVATA